MDSTKSISVDDNKFPPWRRDASPSLLLTLEPNPHSCSRLNYNGVLKMGTLSSTRSDPRKTSPQSNSQHCSINGSHQKKSSKNTQRLVPIGSRDTCTQIIQFTPLPPAPNIPQNSNRLNDMFSVYHQEAEVSIAQIQAHRRQAPVVIESRDTFTQIVHTLPPPPAPNIPQNSNRLYDMCPADNQGAEVSIAQKPAHRRQAPVLLESRDSFTQIVQTSPPPPAPNIPQNLNRLHDMFLADNQEAEVSIAQKPEKVEGNHNKQAIAIETPLTRDRRVKHYFVKSEQIVLK